MAPPALISASSTLRDSKSSSACFRESTNTLCACSNAYKTGLPSIIVIFPSLSSSIRKRGILNKKVGYFFLEGLSPPAKQIDVLMPDNRLTFLRRRKTTSSLPSTEILVSCQLLKINGDKDYARISSRVRPVFDPVLKKITAFSWILKPLLLLLALISSMELHLTGSERSSSAFSNQELKEEAFLAKRRNLSSTAWKCLSFLSSRSLLSFDLF